MCIAVFIWKTHAHYPFLLLLNRDEYHSRPTTPLGWWDGGEILGGKDGLAGGTWLACSRDGKLAFLTNVRELQKDLPVKSRGDLPVRFLEGRKSPKEFAEELAGDADMYGGFNLIVADLCSTSMFYITNRPKDYGLSFAEVFPGIHVLSNAKLDTPWPKQELPGNSRMCSFHYQRPPLLMATLALFHRTTLLNFENFLVLLSATGLPISWQYQRMGLKGRTREFEWESQRLLHAFEDAVNAYGESEISIEEITKNLMNDTTKDDESKLPHIYPPEFEYHLSSIFIEVDTPMGRYGTRSTSAVVLKTSGEVCFYEKYVDKDMWKKHIISYRIEK